MKKSRILLVLFLIMGNTILLAQTHYQGQYSFSMQGGISGAGWCVNANGQKLIGSKFFLGRADISYSEQDINLNILEAEKSEKINYNNYTLGVSIGYSIEKFHPVYIQGFVGPFFGWENFNRGQTEIKGISIEDPSGVIYGVYGGMEIEVSLFPSLSIVGTVQQFYKITSDIGNAFYQASAGLKFNF
jgi:hypothetical protein